MKKIFLILFLITSLILNTKVFAKEAETLILLDASASMLEPLEDSPKYVLAINEVKKVLKTLSSSNAIGLRTIGISMENALQFLAEPDTFCKATSLLVPINKNSLNDISTRLDYIFPLGTTPLTYSIDKAINNDFKNYTYKHIILITDGGESCDANPCQYIQNIMSRRNDIKIDVIAIGVPQAEINDLNCLANATSGQVYNVNSSSDLSIGLNRFLMPNYSNVNTYQKEIQQEEAFEDEIIYKNYLLEE